MSNFVGMTVHEVIYHSDFNNASISQAVFGNKRIISDKIKNNRGKSWMKGDFELIAKYFSEKWKINLEVT